MECLNNTMPAIWLLQRFTGVFFGCLYNGSAETKPATSAILMVACSPRAQDFLTPVIMGDIIKWPAENSPHMAIIWRPLHTQIPADEIEKK